MMTPKFFSHMRINLLIIFWLFGITLGCRSNDVVAPEEDSDKHTETEDIDSRVLEWFRDHDVDLLLVGLEEGSSLKTVVKPRRQFLKRLELRMADGRFDFFQKEGASAVLVISWIEMEEPKKSHRVAYLPVYDGFVELDRIGLSVTLSIAALKEISVNIRC